ncbi:MAG: [FeFe] hydrogenase, group A [Armatimonadetes bacterium]|nr:[FeFe] hydrogenase, group A [Armatimonadota bacterium]MDI9583592.1 NADH-dependent [FeFe] hydrogenase, group A6 [Acidobacteriota bacterium]
MSEFMITINGREVPASPGMTVLNVAQQAGIHIPTLCYHPDLPPLGACRVCLVEIEGERGLQPSCSFPVREGMKIKTHSPKVRKARRTVVELLLSDHPSDCTSCARSGSCELQQLAEDLGIREVRVRVDCPGHPIDDVSLAVVRDPDKCILCRRCLQTCDIIQGVSGLRVMGRGYDSIIGAPFGQALGHALCVNCGQCINRCPTGALTERSYINEVWEALADPDKFVVVQTAPAVRVALGEGLGLPAGQVVTGKLTSALRELGFDRVFDTDFTADLTIMEEGHELIKRITEGGVLPQITSCSPGWIKFVEHFYPQLLPNVSSCKSPQQMFGAVAKTYYAEEAGIDPAKMVVVSIMPCTAKKYEAARPEMCDSGYRDVDYVLTTRELAQMIKEQGIDFAHLPDSDYDDPLGESTGAAVIFGATGGVMEAALRTAYEVITGEKLENIDIEAVRGMDGVKEATVKVGDIEFKAAIAHGLSNAAKLMDKVAAGEADYHFIEIMACPGGCLGGGGQPIPTSPEIRKKRMEAIYAADVDLPIRRSHENPSIARIYEKFLGAPLSHKSHQLLHTEYTPRTKAAVQGPEQG